jgi:uncharacterized membrane protein
MKGFKEIVAIFVIGESGYSLIELFWRGYTHWTMSITGGLCFLSIYKLNTRMLKASFWKKCLASTSLITGIEFVCGCVINRWLKWDVWNYQAQRLNFMGQICLIYSCLWFLLSIPTLCLCNFLKKRYFDF